ncbi:unnamed protein product [Lymnaea stagnalis]|uniref:Uncharacterized protein n=1 Tax=Lymnaea stagnalis TaxID=6523 RepID=A0AAV2H311_LYMST
MFQYLCLKINSENQLPQKMYSSLTSLESSFDKHNLPSSYKTSLASSFDKHNLPSSYKTLKEKKKNCTKLLKNNSSVTLFPSLQERSFDLVPMPKMTSHAKRRKSKSLTRTFSTTDNLDKLAIPPARHRLFPVHQHMINTRLKKLPLLAAIKPDNEQTEKARFMRANYNYNPYFCYKGYSNKEEMEKFRIPSDQYISLAILILENTLAHFGSYEQFDEITGGSILTRSEVYRFVKKYLMNEDLDDEIQINLRDDLLSRGSIYRAKDRYVLSVRCVNLRECCAEGLLRHEIGTHYMRSCNTCLQPWNDPNVRGNFGIGPLNPTEEGLACLHSVMFRNKPFLMHAALLYYTTYKASQMSFRDIFHDLGKYVTSPDVRWDYCLRAKRGQVDTSRRGNFSKDQVYLEGALQLLKRRTTIDFEMLVRLGKVSYQDLSRKCVIDAARLQKTRIPKFMEDIQLYHNQLNRVVRINGLNDSLLAMVE